jgi:predicted methyltransferase
MKMSLRVVALTALLFGALQAQAAAPAADKAAIKAAIASTERLPSDNAEDAWRESAAVLEFLGARPGMKVVDVGAGGGYFTELLSRAVGPQGSVTAQNPMGFVARLTARLEERYGKNRLPNVQRLEGDPMVLPAATYDAALIVNWYHDQYVSRPPPAGAPPAPTPNPAPFVAEVFKSLKSGGIVVVQDHTANSGGAPIEVASTLHRVDPEVVKKDFLAAGFTFDGESKVLRNSTDDHSVRVHEQGMLHKTDRFILRFRKP